MNLAWREGEMPTGSGYNMRYNLWDLDATPHRIVGHVLISTTRDSKGNWVEIGTNPASIMTSNSQIHFKDIDEAKKAVESHVTNSM